MTTPYLSDENTPDIRTHINAAFTQLGTAAGIINVPAGSIAATDVQAAINELDTGKTTLTAVNAFYAPQTATLSAGTITISNSTITNTNFVLYSRSLAGGTLGNLSYVIVDNTSLTFNSDNADDSSNIVYLVL